MKKLNNKEKTGEKFMITPQWSKDFNEVDEAEELQKIQENVFIPKSYLNNPYGYKKEGEKYTHIAEGCPIWLKKDRTKQYRIYSFERIGNKSQNTLYDIDEIIQDIKSTDSYSSDSSNELEDFRLSQKE